MPKQQLNGIFAMSRDCSSMAATIGRNVVLFLSLSLVEGDLRQRILVTAYGHLRVSWNEAKCFCESQGQHLLKLDTEQKHTDIFSMLENILTYDDYWIGLHNAEGRDCFSFQWHDSSILGHFTSWDNSINEPNLCYVDRCIRTTKFGDWRTTECTMRLPVLCEKTESTIPRSYDVINGKDVRKAKTGATTLILHGDLRLCETVCFSSISYNFHCCGIYVENLISSNQCTLYFVEDKTFFAITSNLKNSSGILLIPRYIEVAVSSLRNGDVNIISNKDNDPIATCVHGSELSSLQTDTSYYDVETTPTLTTETPSIPKTTSGLQTTPHIVQTTKQEMTEITTTVGAKQYTQKTKEELESVLANLVSETKVDKKTTSASLRSRISVMETRTSATSMGVTASIVLSCIFAAIFISDIPIIIYHIRLFWCG